MTTLKLVSLFTGAGGLDYGFEAGGFCLRAAVEVDPDCWETIRLSRPEWYRRLIRKDIEQVGTDEILRVGRLRPRQVDALICGPPCQPYSKSGYWANGDTLRLDDPRAATIVKLMDVIEGLLPKVFLVENVPGIAFRDKLEALALIEKRIQNTNRRHGTRYELSSKVLNAADFGVPQLRQRFFLVGDRQGRAFQFPSPTRGPSSNGANRPYITAWDAIGGLSPGNGEDLTVGGEYGDLLPSIPEGQNYTWHTRRGGGEPLFGWRTRYWSFLLKLAKDRPSWTLQAQPGTATGPFHWESRRLSTKEIARLQTFPWDVTFAGSQAAIRRQVGNGVPSLLAEVLAREIRAQLLGSPVAGPLKLRVAQKRDVPPAERRKPVSQRYLSRRGEHPDHPGAGQGPGSRRRALPPGLSGGSPVGSRE